MILCLSVGIGATTSVLSWIEGILLRPFPLVAHQDRMVAMTGIDSNGRTDTSWPDLLDLRRNSTLVEAFIAEHIGGATLNIGDRADRATGSIVSANYFDALGIRPILGRAFLPSEETGRNAHAVAVIVVITIWWKYRPQQSSSVLSRRRVDLKEVTNAGQVRSREQNVARYFGNPPRMCSSPQREINNLAGVFRSLSARRQ